MCTNLLREFILGNKIEYKKNQTFRNQRGERVKEHTTKQLQLFTAKFVLLISSSDPLETRQNQRENEREKNNLAQEGFTSHLSSQIHGEGKR